MASDEAHVPGLFRPYKLGNNRWELSHRVFMPPLTRCRAINGIPNEALVQYYSQRTTNGGLIVAEGTHISPTAHGYPHVPGIYTAEQVSAWKKVTAAVHARGGVFFCQLWHCGRTSHTAYQPDGAPPISSTNKRISSRWKIRLPDGSQDDYSTPRALTLDEIPEIVDDFARAASNAIEAGFDGVEIHGAFGYLVDQFLKDLANDRVDDYGGSLPNRIRFLEDIVRAVARAVGPDRVGVKISPTTYHQDAADSDPLALGIAISERLNQIQEELGSSRLTYLHLQTGMTRDGEEDKETEVVAAIRKNYKGTLMLCGGFDRDRGIKAVELGTADLVGYGRAFLANPDLVRRLKLAAPLNDYDFSTFYTHDPVVGYTDYPFLD